MTIKTSILSFLIFLTQLVYAQNEPVAKVPFRYDGSHIMVEGRINGSAFKNFVFDTGASMSLVDETEADEMGLESDQTIEGQGASGSANYQLSLDNKLSLKGIAFEKENFLIYDLEHMKRFGSELTGVLGFQEISKYVVKIDYEEEILTFYNKYSYEYKGSGTIIPIGLEMNIPSVSGEIILNNGKNIEGRFLVDTGAGLYGGINTPTVKKFEAIEALENNKYVVQASGANSTFNMTIGRVSKLSFGDFEFEQLPMTFNKVEQGALADPNYIGIIGNKIMKRFDIILDYESNRMILEPNGLMDEEYAVNSSGFFTSPRGNNVVIDRIQEDSPATKLGLKPGDVLLQVNNTKVTPQNRLFIRDLMENHGKTYTLKWSRNGKEMKGEIQLKRLI